jgi:hypothetical protein
MAEQGITPTFRPDVDGIETPDIIILSGVYLRQLYILRKRETQIVDWVAAEIDPTCVPNTEMELLISTWRAEAELLYPREGDYRVRIKGEGGVDIPTGDDVTFVIERDTFVDPCEVIVVPPDCIQYSWDITGSSPGDFLTLEYTNCAGVVTLLQDYSENLDLENFVCALEGTVSAEVGVITVSGPCVIIE